MSPSSWMRIVRAPAFRRRWGSCRSDNDVSGHVSRQGRLTIELSSFAQGLIRLKTSRTRSEPGLLASSFGRFLPPPVGRQTL